VDDPGTGKIVVIPGKDEESEWLWRTARIGTGVNLEGEVVVSALAWILEESEQGTVLTGTKRIEVKKSTRRCRSMLTKDAKAGAPNPIKLFRRPVPGQ
jgi:hypothetical protein